MFFVTRYSALRRKVRALDAQELMSRDERPPVLYLRSFKDDPTTARIVLSTTEEEQLAMVMREIGPFVAIGRPGEELPELGAARIYVADDEWQETITALMRKAQLVVLRIGQTEGFWWEVQRAVQYVQPEHLLFLVPHNKTLYEDFRGQAAVYLPAQLPAYERGAGSFGSLNGLIYFGPDWTPRFVRMPFALSSLIKAGWKDAGVPVLKTALRPVFAQLKLKWQPPVVRPLQAVLMGLFLLMVLYSLYSLF